MESNSGRIRDERSRWRRTVLCRLMYDFFASVSKYVQVGAAFVRGLRRIEHARLHSKVAVRTIAKFAINLVRHAPKLSNQKPKDPEETSHYVNIVERSRGF
jgi:hypothetical protein